MQSKASRQVGVYVHVPYCRRICCYCDFNVVRWQKEATPWAAYATALTHELTARRPAYGQHQLVSVYFGGGTPSLMPASFVGDVLAAVSAACGSQPLEVTLEVDPGATTPQELAQLRQLGVNRLSIGWQSTHDRLLKMLARAHSAATSQATFVAARSAGFSNVSIDLIFGLPTQTHAELDADLDAIGALEPEHVSLYELTYHEGTPLERRRQQGKVLALAEDDVVAMMARIHARLERYGYGRYEVSNYARPGFRAQHNQLYWQGVEVLGLGAGAHSLLRRGDGGLRWEGLRDPVRYMEAWQQPRAASAPDAADTTVEWAEALTPAQLRAERIFCGLRLSDGLPLADLEEAAVQTALSRGWGSVVADRYLPTPLGLRFADSAAELLA